MDEDDFNQWRENAVTKWVMARLQALALTHLKTTQDYLLAGTVLPPAEWQALQPEAAFRRGQADYAEFLANLTLEQLTESDG